MKALFNTDDGWSGLILRLTLGLVMLPHGAQKVAGLVRRIRVRRDHGFFHPENGATLDHRVSGYQWGSFSEAWGCSPAC
jgi:hypothetical protein